MLISLKSLVPLCHEKHRTVLDGLWVQQLNISSVQTLPALLQYLKTLPALTKAGEVQSHELLPADMRTALRPLTDLVSTTAQDLGLLPDEDKSKNTMHERALLMSMRGAQPHVDIPHKRWMDKLFWALSLHDTDTDVLFGNLGYRVALMAGTLLIFDPCQPHAVIAREHGGFKKSHFSKDRVQYCAGGDFSPVDWAALGVRHNLSPSEYAARRNVANALVHQETCILKRTSVYSRWADSMI